MTYQIWRGRGLKWTVFAIGTASALRLFFVQELLAVFLLFCVAFFGLAVVLLVLFLVGHVAKTAALWAGGYLKALAIEPWPSRISEVKSPSK